MNLLTEGKMTGFIYRRAINLKNLGERLGWDWLIRIGLCLREAALHGQVR